MSEGAPMNRPSAHATRPMLRARAVELSARATAVLGTAVPLVLLIAATLAVVACNNGGSGPAY